jgi:hypothetical protein
VKPDEASSVFVGRRSPLWRKAKPPCGFALVIGNQPQRRDFGGALLGHRFILANRTPRTNKRTETRLRACVPR